MKKLALALFVFGLALAAQAFDFNTTVTSQVCILSGVNAQAAPWTPSAAYTNGAIAVTSNRIWMCLVAGTSGTSNGPSGLYQTTEGSVTWIPVLRQRRGGWYLKNMTANSRIMWTDTPTATASNGFALDYLDAIAGGQARQGPIYVFGTNSAINFGEHEPQ